MRNMNVVQASELFPVGTKVKYFPIAGRPEFEKRVVASDPWEMCGETVVKVQGRSGCVSVNHLEVICV